MNLLKRPALAGAVLLLCLQGAFAAQSSLSAEEAVRGYIDELLARVAEIKPLFEADRARYFREVEDALERFVDFREVARGVMARYGAGPNGASAEQLDRFAEVFKSSVVDFYGSALASYGGQDYVMLDSREQGSNGDAAAEVRMRVEGENGDGFELQYSMFRNAGGQWKLRNLYVEGVNLRRQYYSRFDDLMRRHDYDIDAVIDNWNVE